MSGRGAYRGGRGGTGGGPARGGRGRGGGRGRSDGGSSRGGGRDSGGRARGRDSGGRGGGRGRGGRGPSGPETVTNVITNSVEAGVMESFDFYMIGLDAQNKHGEQIDSASRRSTLFYIGLRKLLEDLPKAEREFYIRTTFAKGSTAFAGRSIPGLEPNLVLCDGSTTEGDSIKVVGIERFIAPACLELSTSAPAGAGGLKMDQIRCQRSAKTFSTQEKLLQHCRDSGDSPIVINDDEEARVAEPEVFLAYINSALQRAMGEQLVRWGQDYFDPNDFKEDFGLKIFRAISLSFSLAKIAGKKVAELVLTCDLKSKVMRLSSLLDEVNRNRSKVVPSNVISSANRKWVNEAVIYKSDRKRYEVIKLHFDKSPDSMPIPGTTKSHTEYFASKGTKLEFPHCPPMVEVKGRRDKSIFLPPELVFQYELDPKSRMKLPQLASYDAPTRHEAIDKALTFLTPGKSKSIGGTLLPALGVILAENRIKLKAKTLSFPSLVASGLKQFGNNFKLASADYKVDPKQATILNVVLFHNEYIQGYEGVYQTLRDSVNRMNSKYRFADRPFKAIETNTIEQHFGAVEKFFSSNVPPNVFVLDFANPKAALDAAYPVVKMTLAQSGYLSQFVNWKTCAHDSNDEYHVKKSGQILDNVARQILQKAGICLWYATLPPEIPLPVMFLGIDVFHAPIVFDPKTKTKGRKSSVVAFVFNVIEKPTQQGRPIVAKTYTRTYRRDPGEEFNLKSPLQASVREAVEAMGMLPKSVFVYRDGMNATSSSHELAEIEGVRQGLKIVPVGGGSAPAVPIAYINCQKRIANKFLTTDGQFAAPPGTMITGIQGLKYKTFYINSSAPRGSTGKPTRFELVKRDAALRSVKIEELTYALCYTYANWTGQIKVPGPVQCAHKAAELAGSMADGGESINAKAYTNTSYYL